MSKVVPLQRRSGILPPLDLLPYDADPALDRPFDGLTTEQFTAKGRLPARYRVARYARYDRPSLRDRVILRWVELRLWWNGDEEREARDLLWFGVKDALIVLGVLVVALGAVAEAVRLLGAMVWAMRGVGV